MVLRFLTLNVRGVRDPTKRRTVFNYLRDNKIDIAFLQETHSESSNYRFWRAEWGAELFLSHGTNASCGVAVAFRRNLPISVVRSFADESGRCLLLQISYLNRSFFLLNVYAPSDRVSSRVQFFQFLEEFLADRVSSDTAPLIIGGDFNTHLSSLDKSTVSPTLPFSPTECARVLGSLMTQYDLVDLWRSLNGTHGFRLLQWFFLALISFSYLLSL